MPDIHYLGHSCFRLRGKEGVVLTDPYDDAIGYDIGKPSATIVTISHQHPDHAHAAAVRPLRENLFTLEGPGEYEISGILVSGVRTFRDKKKGAEQGRNTVYVIHMDDMVFCHLGDLAHELTSQQLDEIGEVDILFVPVGGGETINATEAVAVIAQIEPRMVIPMHYAVGDQPDNERDLAPLDKFLQEVGLKDVVPDEKLTVTRAVLPAEGQETRINVMKFSRGV